MNIHLIDGTYELFRGFSGDGGRGRDRISSGLSDPVLQLRPRLAEGVDWAASPAFLPRVEPFYLAITQAVAIMIGVRLKWVKQQRRLAQVE